MTAAVRCHRDRDGHPAPDRRQDVARRAAGALHDDARRRPGRPVRDRPQRLRAARRSSASRARARCRTCPRAGQQRRHRRRRHPRAGHPGPGRRARSRGRPRTSPRRASRWPAPRPRRSRPASRGSSSGSRSRARSAARCGRTPGAHESEIAAVLESARVLLADGTEATCRPAELGLAYRDSRLQARRPADAPAGLVVEATFRSSRPTRTRSRPASTTSAAGARRTSRSASRRPAASSATRPGDSAGRLIEAAGLKGRRIGGAVVSREARQLHRQRPEGDAPRTSAASPTWSAPRSTSGTASTSSSRSCSSATGRAGTRRGVTGDATPGRRRRRPPGRPVRGARRLDRVRDGDRRRARRRRGPRSARSSSTSTAAGGGCRSDHRRGDRPAAAYDDPAALGARGPADRRGGAGPPRGATNPAPVVFIALHGPFGEDGTVQALLEAAGLAYTGAGVAASALGMDKALFKRLCRGLGLPVIDWREVRAERWARDRAGVLAELEAFAAGAGDPRLMVKPARLGSSVGMTLAHDAGERTAGPRPRRSATTTLALVERTWPARATSRSRSSATTRRASSCTGRARSSSGHEFYDYAAKYTPGLSETSSTQAEVDRRASGRRCTSSPATRTARSAPRASPGSTSSSPATPIYLSEINTIPGFTPISLFPTLPAEGGYDFAAVCRPDRRARARAARRPGRRATPRRPPTCRDEPRRPMSSRRRPRAGPIRRRPVGAPAGPPRLRGPVARPGRRALLVMLARRRRSTASSSSSGVRARPTSRSTGATCTDAAT